MADFKNKFQKITKSHSLIAGILLLLLLAVFLLWFNVSNSMQAKSTLRIEVYFEGEYRIADGPWMTYVEGEHIPATKGDVTLRGNFYQRYEGEFLGVYRYDPKDPDARKAAIYVNHINLSFYEVNEDGEKECTVIDNENPIFGDSNCGKAWTIHGFVSDPEELIEIIIHNPHRFGNENAIDEMLDTMEIYFGIDFDRRILDSGATERNMGLFFVMVSAMLLGIALFSVLIRIKNAKIIWVLGSFILFAGIYFAYHADGVAFWSEFIVSNTTILGASMMFYMFFLAILIVCILSETRKIGKLTVIMLGVANAVIFLVPIVSDVLFYDLWVWWIVVQMIANVVLSVCLAKEISISLTKQKWLLAGAFLPLVAFAADVIGVWYGIWKGGVVSQCAFTVLFVVSIVMVTKLIPQKINAAAKAKELELEKMTLNAQLTESRVSTMMSQIRPHFIYNTLGSIEQLCKLDPPKAGELVHNFAKYLRGNFGELDNPKPILMSQEMEHVHHYISIENVRFPDMTFTFEMNCEDFSIPALTVQPIVENAIKHGLMKLPKGGSIRVVSYEADTHYCILVEDDGVGFDTNALLDERKHVGLRNIRERLKVMVNGTLEIESTVGVGTKVLIKIPKEVSK
ncbi:MAG: histidine kinase [Clostridia bacterium]|nr:histidine kinase [Clostridia bacterium]